MSADELHQLRGQDIAVIFQEPMTALNPIYTVGDQIVESLEHSDLRGAAAWKESSRGDAPGRDRRAGAPRAQLSAPALGGQRQRAMIAMALACNRSS